MNNCRHSHYQKLIPVHPAESSQWTLCWPISIGCCQLCWYESFMHLKFFHGRINWIKLKTAGTSSLGLMCDLLSENPALPCKYWIQVRGDFIHTGRFPAKLSFCTMLQETCTVSHWIVKPDSATYKDGMSSNSHGTCFQKTRFHKDGWLESS